MDEPSSGKIAFCRVVYAAGMLVGQLFFGINGIDPVKKALHVVVPLAVFFHESKGLTATCGARSENQNVALRLILFRGLSFIKGLDHE